MMLVVWIFLLKALYLSCIPEHSAKAQRLKHQLVCGEQWYQEGSRSAELGHSHTARKVQKSTEPAKQ